MTVFLLTVYYGRTFPMSCNTVCTKVHVTTARALTCNLCRLTLSFQRIPANICMNLTFAETRDPKLRVRR